MHWAIAIPLQIPVIFMRHKPIQAEFTGFDETNRNTVLQTRQKDDDGLLDNTFVKFSRIS